ncbi:MAG: protease complex subunit PrcB family protein [Elusimicrobia bacterium]|nr:protease complex subunit PrcB family protein [Elusimicrobiota bacterium]
MKKALLMAMAAAVFPMIAAGAVEAGGRASAAPSGNASASAGADVAGWEAMSGQNSAIDYPQMVAVRDAKGWAELWAEHLKGSPLALAVPAADFSKETVVAVFLGLKPTGGYKVELSLQQDPMDSSRLFVLYREVPPRTGAIVSQVVSRPFEIRKVRKVYASVVFEPNLTMRALPFAMTQGVQARLGRVVSALEDAARSGLP